ncbi:protein XRI1-like isoform X2 [Mangifera indica]|uniref:protein XRI1-like isoform X2 n=1 Tax=Mangifera indica TaxID=29780 RepID=UPI001CFA41EE|nr:protein XRI1-like isoform X2 [Mangifera indica]
MRMSTTRGPDCGSNEILEPWNWQRDENCHQMGSNFDMWDCQWNELTLNAEDLSYMLDDVTTPVKECGDLAYYATYSGNVNKEQIEQRENSSRLKRRRVLQFDDEVAKSSLFSSEMPSAFLAPNERENRIDEVLPEVSPWVSGFADVPDSSLEGLDQSFERWLAQCLNDSEMNFSPDDMNFSMASDGQIDITDFSNPPPACDANVVQPHVPRTPQRNIIFKGRKSIIRAPTKLASSVAYPFAFVKPCGVQGDVTLKDINQWIHTPSKLKQDIENPAAYPTSAFSGKPVVGKTKIRTEGGKGSITIMRTKG